MRAHMSEFGIVAPVGRMGVERLLEVIADHDDTRIPADARVCLEMLGAQLVVVKEQLLENDRRIRASARETEVGRRLMEIPGVDPLLASAFVSSVADPTIFKCGRDLAAWINLVPKQNSSSGTERLGGISRAGNRYLRQMLVVGAMAVIRHAERHGTKRAGLLQLLARRATKVAAVALANKTLEWSGADDERRTVSGAGGDAGIRSGAGSKRRDEVGKGGQELMHEAG